MTRGSFTSTPFSARRVCRTATPATKCGFGSARMGASGWSCWEAGCSDPNTDEVVDVGLPFGPKPRLVLYHLNAEALRTRSPVIEMEDSLTAFVKRTLKLD